MSLVDQLIPLWKKKFGDNLLGIAVSASVARGEDQAYSDLELDVFLREKPEKRDEQYLQRVVDGMLIEAIYHTPDEYLQERSSITHHWYLSASDHWMVVYNQSFFDDLMKKLQAIHHHQADFWVAATRGRYEFQESFSKVLNVVEIDNQEGISLLLMDAVMKVLKILALINQLPFTTFSRFITEARQFQIKPDRLDDMLDLLVFGIYRELESVREVCLAVFQSMEEIFRQNGIELFADELDPNLPNRSMLHPV
ncbi:MAG: hypothetical protein CVU41_06555 [Chloroflexi bacterium HGW-Chloroflexi-3]|nr:MAG: hypothetical protein CVU41_06555 [Chloroflexi bacterium HGW-Chloroflexi-3]